MSGGIFNRQTGYLNRKSIRLPGYDYSQPGYYFVTICVHDRKQSLFGDIFEKKMILNDFGSTVQNEILRTEQIRSNVKIDEYVIMPNHCHIIYHLRRIDDVSRRGTLQRVFTKKHHNAVPFMHQCALTGNNAMRSHDYPSQHVNMDSCGKKNCIFDKCNEDAGKFRMRSVDSTL